MDDSTNTWDKSGGVYYIACRAYSQLVRPYHDIHCLQPKNVHIGVCFVRWCVQIETA